MSTPSLLLRHLRSRASTSVALAVLVGVAVAVAALLPRGLVVLSDAELQHELASLAPGVTDLYGTGEFGTLNTSGTPTSAEQVFGSTDSVLADVPGGLPSPLRDSLGTVSWMALLPPDQVNIPEPRAPHNYRRTASRTPAGTPRDGGIRVPGRNRPMVSDTVASLVSG